MGGGGVRRGGYYGNVGLVVVVGVEGEHAREGVVGREGDLQGLVAAGGLRGDVLDVAAQGTLVAPREVGTQVEVVAHAATATACGALAYAEELHVGHLVAYTEDDIVGVGLDELHGRHAEVHHAALVVLQLHGHVVEQGDVDTHEGRELLVDAHGRDVEHRRGHGAAGGDIGDEAEAVHVLHIGAVGVERTHGIDALVGVVDVDALEIFLEHLQLAQAAVGEAPVGQHRQHGGEETQAGGAGIAARIGGEEGGYHHVGRVLAHAAVGGVEGHTGKGCALGVYGTAVLALHAALHGLEAAHEVGKAL